MTGMIPFRRRSLLAGLAALAALPAGARRAPAQPAEFPDRPLRLVVGFPPGGPNDLLARIVAPGIGERLKRSVVVENRAGSNGEIAAAAVAKSPADGSVIMLASNGSTTVAPALNKNLPYDVRTDFVAVAPIGINPMLLVTRPDLPARDVGALLALAHAQPGKLNGASAGAGGATHLALELFKSMGKADIVHVPYKGGGPAMADLMAGMVDVYFGGLSTALPHVRSGKLRGLGQTSLQRSAAAADIPTIAEAGLPGYEAAISYGIFLPAGAAPALVGQLHAAVDATLRSPEVARKFVELGADPQFGTPREFAAYVAEDKEKWARLAREAGLRSD